MPNYTVFWETEVEAQSSLEAAHLARAQQLKCHGLYCFIVEDEQGNRTYVDLLGEEVIAKEEPCVAEE